MAGVSTPAAIFVNGLFVLWLLMVKTVAVTSRPCVMLCHRYVTETTKSGRDDRIRTCDPLTPSQVRYQAALHPELSVGPAKAGHYIYAEARLLRLAGRAGFLAAATRFDATAAFDRAAIDRRAPFTSDGDSRR